ncbi:unnamed protein product [Penicillium salamii]|nr:unnamed protein product [Penicillium salamii]CAG8200521.1 unnamed protein product [Penicillium salamii]CAG8302198.1 unnamed protein product [Penicillium salamii]
MAPRIHTAPAAPKPPAVVGAKVKTVGGPKRGRLAKSTRLYYRTAKLASPTLSLETVNRQQWIMDEQISSIPLAMQGRLIASCHVEFLDEHGGAVDNHVNFRLMFVNPQTEGSRYAPAGTLGVTMGFREIGTAARPNRAVLWGESITAAGPHLNSMRSIAVPVAPGTRLRSLLRQVRVQDMLPADYTPVAGGTTIGSRDMMSQWLSHCAGAGILVPPPAVIGGPVGVWNDFNYVWLRPRLAGEPPFPVAPAHVNGPPPPPVPAPVPGNPAPIAIPVGNATYLHPLYPYPAIPVLNY